MNVYIFIWQSKTKIIKIKVKNLPFVSVCTPTFNRRPFIKSMIKCFDHRVSKDKWNDYYDDGTDPIEDLVATNQM